LDDVYQKRLTANELLVETVRWLLIVREEKRQRMNSLLAGLKVTQGETSLPAEGIVNLIEHHLKLKNRLAAPRCLISRIRKHVNAFVG
jgi:DNA adenine methylase